MVTDKTVPQAQLIKSSQVPYNDCNTAQMSDQNLFRWQICHTSIKRNLMECVRYNLSLFLRQKQKNLIAETNF